MSAERWVPIPGHPGYEVSDMGRVASLPRRFVSKRVVMSSRLNKDGYPALNLSRHGHKRRYVVHLLVLAGFVGPRPDGCLACHNNGDPTDNRLTNLRWDTPRANNFDILRHGRHANVAKTHCPQGHPYSPENTRTYIRKDGSGNPGRWCRTCHRDRERERARSRRARVPA